MTNKSATTRHRQATKLSGLRSLLSAFGNKPSGVYTAVQHWQTRVLRLHAGTKDEALRADLLVADLVEGSGLVLHAEQRRKSYEAISYRWGEAIFPEIITCNGTDCSITTNLAAALRDLRYVHTERYLWADALCIDQTSNKEKSVQVRNMFSIYRKAARVLVWLCERDRNVSLAESQWANRVWVQQEIFVAQEVKVYYGSEYKLFEQLMGPDRRLRMAGEETILDLERLRYLEGCIERGRAPAWQACDCDARVEEWPIHKGTGIRDLQHTYRIECVLYRDRSCQASDPRDHVYGLLSTSRCRAGNESDKTTLNLRIDYSRSLSQVFQDVTRYIINRDRDLGILHFFAPHREANRSHDLPTWTPDWQYFEDHPKIDNQTRFLDVASKFEWQDDDLDAFLGFQGIKVAEVISVESAKDPMYYPVEVWDPKEACNLPNRNLLTCRPEASCSWYFNLQKESASRCTQECRTVECVHQAWTIGDAQPGDYLVLVRDASRLLLLRRARYKHNDDAMQYFTYVGTVDALKSTGLEMVGNITKYLTWNIPDSSWEQMRVL